MDEVRSPLQTQPPSAPSALLKEARKADEQAAHGLKDGGHGTRARLSGWWVWMSSEVVP